MDVCVECGRPAGTARFCSGCGHPVAPVAVRGTDTAERPAVRASLPPAAPAPPPARGPSTLPPPPAFQPPPPARYPLFADQVDDATRRAVPPAAPSPQPHVVPQPRRRVGAWLPLGVTLVALALVAMTGALLLTSGTEEPAPVVADDPAPGSAAEVAPADAVPDGPTLTPRQPESGSPERRSVDVTVGATVQAPRTAAPQQDVRGAAVSYAAANMLDGAARTSWRMPGDGTGEEIVIRLAQPTRITEVGLINGYAKVDGRFDWYAGNRRVRTVEWRFDDGTVVRHALRDERGLQTTRITAVTARTVRLRLLSVSRPGTGPSGRDFTAISELALLGSTA